eukprot:CAMPEP_0204533078 /NCGR_PEP_ID=MMETSP0661-20131031/12077_1 /ASSEMBLY_ACC=CAM_ASM_000606 /TAXON_ID=109239 /ORGANISM="Alexandrium margalefi, Strain AMGDE01CS-322" /LENGTH=359 /DNA_ID=CAMNT_0051539377 /DNA_START=81 /DNA_END=1160 /DNA_ORIENTATION=-
MAPWRTALLVLAALAPARAEFHEDEHGTQQVVERVDPMSSSFYIEVRRKGPARNVLRPARRSRAEQAKSFGRAAVVGVNSAVVANWIIYPLFRKLASRLVPPDNARSSETAVVSSSAVGTRHAEPTPPETVRPPNSEWAAAARSWQLSAVVALTAVAALCSSKARGHLASRRRVVRRGANAVTPVAGRKFAQPVSSRDSDHSTDLNGTPTGTPSTSSNDSSSNATDDSESDLADSKDSPSPRRSPAWAETTCKLRLEGAKALTRQGSAPAGSVTRTRSFGRQDSSTSEHGPGVRMPQFQLTPAEEMKWNVRQRAAEFERKIEFHRMASESSTHMDDNEYERSMDLRADFYRIGTEVDYD